jgi:hypothetical protein
MFLREKVSFKCWHYLSFGRKKYFMAADILLVGKVLYDESQRAASQSYRGERVVVVITLGLVYLLEK